MIRWIKFTFAPWVKRHLPLLITFWVLLAAPGCLKFGDDGLFHFAKVRFLCCSMLAFAPALLFTWLSSLKQWGKYLICGALLFLTITEFYLFFTYKTRMSNRIILLINQTNGTEASEFISHYLCNWYTLLTIACIIGVTFGIYQLTKLICNRKSNLLNIKFIGIITTILLTISLVFNTLAIFTPFWYEQLAYPSIMQFGIAIGHSISQSHKLEDLEAVTAHADGSLAYDSDIPEEIIWVIGESFNKYHSPLYGYKLNTQPRLEKEYNDGNLLVFNNVMTPSISTQEVMEYIYSTRGANQLDNYEDYPLLPTLLKNAGYHVYLHDNQTTMSQGDLKWDQKNMWFLNSKKVSEASLNYRNTELYPYDKEFIERELQQHGEQKPMFSIYHLMGQHLPAQKRYDTKYSVFSPSNYKYRKTLTEEQIQDLIHYDNATRYNDIVIGEIINSLRGKDAILIYHSDHGEEIHDFRNQYGRTLEAPNAYMYKYLYEVPFFVYTTPEYRSRHAQTYKRIKEAVNNKINLADVSQIILDIAGVESRWFNSERSPLNSK
ncbi:MAG: phosphoethanolamine transferase [Muribaculaceae bacterium]|nr:phosphoethanolamine transferase [Muribaculaceae bacterium]